MSNEANNHTDEELLERIRQVTMDHLIIHQWRPARQMKRVARLKSVLRKHPNTELVCCAGERTGDRFGRRLCRRGRCARIGYTSWDGAGSGYQIWAVWPKEQDNET